MPLKRPTMRDIARELGTSAVTVSKAMAGKPGKSEAWYILDAAPGAKLVYGVDTHGEDLNSIVSNAGLETML